MDRERSAADEEWTRQSLPSTWESWLGDGFLGIVRYRRKFGCPTGLGEHDRVWLVVEDPPSRVCYRLNGQELVANEIESSAFRCDVTLFLQTRNELLIDVSREEPSEDGGLQANVQLLIVSRRSD